MAESTPQSTAPLAEELTAPAHAAPLALQVGHYAVGEAFCPYLSGYPDVRY